jgi:hypothetical protein
VRREPSNDVPQAAPEIDDAVRRGDAAGAERVEERAEEHEGALPLAKLLRQPLQLEVRSHEHPIDERRIEHPALVRPALDDARRGAHAVPRELGEDGLATNRSTRERLGLVIDDEIRELGGVARDRVGLAHLSPPRSARGATWRWDTTPSRPRARRPAEPCARQGREKGGAGGFGNGQCIASFTLRQIPLHRICPSGHGCWVHMLFLPHVDSPHPPQ